MKTKGLNIKLGEPFSNKLGKLAKVNGTSKAFEARRIIEEEMKKKGVLKAK